MGRIASYGLQLLVWKVKSETTNLDNTALEEEVELYAECSVNLSKLFQVEPKLTKVDEWTTVEDRFVDFTERMWKDGKLLGNAHVECRVILPSFLKQMLVCVRTETGIQSIKPGFAFVGTQTSSPEIKRLAELKGEIEESFMNLNMEQNSVNGKERRIGGLKYSIVQGLNDATAVLRTTTVEGKKHFKYRSEEDLQRAQMVLIDLGLCLLECLNDKDVNITEACYRTLVELISRECLGLTYMQFSQEDIEKLQTEQHSSSLPKKVRERLDIRLKYQAFLYRALQSALSSFCKKVQDEYERLFAVLMAAQCFFRMPLFRTAYLNALTAANTHK